MLIKGKWIQQNMLYAHRDKQFMEHNMKQWTNTRVK